MKFAPRARSLQWGITFIFSALLILSLLRLGLFTANYDHFKELRIFQVGLAMLNGVRFDLSILLIFCGLPLLLLQLPLFHRYFQRFFLLLSYFLFQPILLLVIADLLFFRESQFHIGKQLLLISDDWRYIAEMAIYQYWPYLVIYFLQLIAAILLIIKITATNERPYARWRGILHFVLIGAFLFYGINGKIGLKIDRMISTSDAFTQGTIPFGNLSLNGAFTSFQVIKEKRWRNETKFFTPGQAISFGQQVLDYDGLSRTSASFPFLHSLSKFYAPRMPKNSNIVLIMLESWSAQYIDSYSDGKRAPLGITPNFDRLVADGISFHQFYPNGSMSLYGASSILTSLPPLPRLPAMGKGIEVFNLMRPGHFFKSLGYSTFAAQSSIRVSFRLDTIANYMGFSDYYGKEDYPRLYAANSPTNGWDGETFSFLKNKLRTIKRPFFSFIFTGTTHIPYQVPDPRFQKYEHKDKEITGFYNTLLYSDAMLGDFMSWCRQQSWYDNTLFVFVADHTLNRSVFGDDARIPLLLYSPKWLAPSKNYTLGSQVDIFPTILDILGISGPYAGIGRSLFAPGPKFVMNETSQRVGLIYPDGSYLQHDLHQLISSTFKDNEEQVKALSSLLALEQGLLETIENNRLYKLDTEAVKAK